MEYLVLEALKFSFFCCQKWTQKNIFYGSFVNVRENLPPFINTCGWFVDAVPEEKISCFRVGVIHFNNPALV